LHSCAIENFFEIVKYNNTRLEFKICNYVINEYFELDVKHNSDNTVHYKMHITYPFKWIMKFRKNYPSINFPR